MKVIIRIDAADLEKFLEGKPVDVVPEAGRSVLEGTILVECETPERLVFTGFKQGVRLCGVRGSKVALRTA